MNRRYSYNDLRDFATSASVLLHGKDGVYYVVRNLGRPVAYDLISHDPDLPEERRVLLAGAKASEVHSYLSGIQLVASTFVCYKEAK